MGVDASEKRLTIWVRMRERISWIPSGASTPLSTVLTSKTGGMRDFARSMAFSDLLVMDERHITDGKVGAVVRSDDLRDER